MSTASSRLGAVLVSFCFPNVDREKELLAFESFDTSRSGATAEAALVAE